MKIYKCWNDLDLYKLKKAFKGLNTKYNWFIEYNDQYKGEYFLTLEMKSTNTYNLFSTDQSKLKYGIDSGCDKYIDFLFIIDHSDFKELVRNIHLIELKIDAFKRDMINELKQGLTA